MAGFTARALGLSVCLLAFLNIVPASADPFFVKVYGRTYKVEPRYPPDELRLCCINLKRTRRIHSNGSLRPQGRRAGSQGGFRLSRHAVPCRSGRGGSSASPRSL